MSHEFLVATERVNCNRRNISRSSNNIYLVVPHNNGYSPLFSRDQRITSDYYSYSSGSNSNIHSTTNRQRSSSMTTSPVRRVHKNRRRRSLSPMLTVNKSNSNILETIQRRSSLHSISPKPLQPKPAAKRLDILVIGGENAGKASLAEFLNGSSISSSSSSSEGWGAASCSSSVSRSPQPRDVNIRVHNDPFGLSHVYKYDCVLLIYSVTDASTFKYIKSLISLTANINQKPVILVGNKIDLVRARVISTSDGQRLATEHNLKFIETSALLNLNLNELLSGVKAQVSLKSSKKKVNLLDKIAGFLSYGRVSKSCLDLHTL